MSQNKLVIPSDEDEIKALLQRVNRDKPKREDVERLRAWLRRDSAIWEVAGNLMKQARGIVLDNTNFGTSKTIVIESVEAGVEHLQKELGYGRASMLEKLLIEQILTCWVRLSLAESRYSSNFTSDRSIKVAGYWERVLSASQRRYLRAIETLARVRRLKLPTLQLNVAQPGAKQLNVAASVADDRGVGTT